MEYWNVFEKSSTQLAHHDLKVSRNRMTLFGRHLEIVAFIYL